MKIIFLLVSLLYLTFCSKECFEMLISDKSECYGRYIKDNQNNNKICCFAKIRYLSLSQSIGACIVLEKGEAVINKMNEQINSYNFIVDEVVCDE